MNMTITAPTTISSARAPRGILRPCRSGARPADLRARRTASRQPTWDTAAQLQNQMFATVAAIGGLDVQLVYYRG